MVRRNKRNGGRPGRRRVADRRGGNQMIPHPPQLPSYGIVRDVRMRFISNAAFSAQITFQNLLDTIGVAITTVLGANLFDAVRLNSIEMWAIPAVGSGPQTLILTFNGSVLGAVGDQKTHTDTSMGLEPAHVKCRPDKRTQAGQFQNALTNPAFDLVCPINTVIDVSLSFRQPVFGNVINPANALVGATPGAVYYRGLDGKAAGVTVLPVVGAISTE